MSINELTHLLQNIHLRYEERLSSLEEQAHTYKNRLQEQQREYSERFRELEEQLNQYGEMLIKQNTLAYLPAVGFAAHAPIPLTGGRGDTVIPVRDLTQLPAVLANLQDHTIVKIIANGELNLNGQDIVISGVRGFSILCEGDVTLTNGLMRIEWCNDFIVAGLKIIRPGTQDGSPYSYDSIRRSNGEDNKKDCLTIRNFPDEVNVFRISGMVLSDATDGNLDIIWNRGHDVYGTIDHCLIERSHKAVLVNSGHETWESGRYFLTFNNNHFRYIDQRIPYIRGRGYTHILNNVIEYSGRCDGSGHGGSIAGEDASVLTEQNVVYPYSIGDKHWSDQPVEKPVTSAFRIPKNGNGQIKNIDNLLLNGAKQADSGHVTAAPYPYMAQKMNQDLMVQIKLEAGRMK